MTAPQGEAQLPPRRTAQPPPPEALGPGSEQADGSILYGLVERPTVYVEPARPAWEREADAARAEAGCTRCAEVPAEVLGAITAALRAAKGRPA
jgi:hypothetical protein